MKMIEISPSTFSMAAVAGLFKVCIAKICHSILSKPAKTDGQPDEAGDSILSLLDVSYDMDTIAVKVRNNTEQDVIIRKIDALNNGKWWNICGVPMTIESHDYRALLLPFGGSRFSIDVSFLHGGRTYSVRLEDALPAEARSC